MFGSFQIHQFKFGIHRWYVENWSQTLKYAEIFENYGKYPKYAKNTFISLHIQKDQLMPI